MGGKKLLITGGVVVAALVIAILIVHWPRERFPPGVTVYRIGVMTPLTGGGCELWAIYAAGC